MLRIGSQGLIHQFIKSTKTKMKKLCVIIPSFRGFTALPTIESALNQQGEIEVQVLVAGKSCQDKKFVDLCDSIDPRVVAVPSPDEGPIMPGRARNIALDYLALNGGSSEDYVLFLDDDIVIPTNFAHKLIEFLDSHTDTFAVMSRLETRPVSYTSRVIDYSNFWWLQVRKDIADIGWLGGGLTMTKYSSIGNSRFPSNRMIREDTKFFQDLALKTGKRMSIYSGITAEHWHSRKGWKELIRYQYKNGEGQIEEGSNLNLGRRWQIKQTLHLSRTAIRANWKSLWWRPWLVLGIVLSFAVMTEGSRAYANHRSSNSSIFSKNQS